MPHFHYQSPTTMTHTQTIHVQQKEVAQHCLNISSRNGPCNGSDETCKEATPLWNSGRKKRQEDYPTSAAYVCSLEYYMYSVCRVVFVFLFHHSSIVGGSFAFCMLSFQPCILTQNELFAKPFSPQSTLYSKGTFDPALIKVKANNVPKVPNNSTETATKCCRPLILVKCISSSLYTLLQGTLWCLVSGTCEQHLSLCSWQHAFQSVCFFLPVSNQCTCLEVWQA